jgi:hypothetical protein
MFARTRQVAFFATITRARSHAPGLVIPVKKYLDFKANDGFAEIVKPLPPGFLLW